MEWENNVVTVKPNDKGLVPAIAQHASTGQVLMLGWMSQEALQRTLEGGEAWFYSRSRSDLWHKGETSGTFLRVESVWADCDRDTLLLKVEPTGPQVCHTGQPTCFFTQVTEPPTFERSGPGAGVLEELFATIQQRRRDMPQGSYTTQLFQQGVPRIAQKVLEEAGEVAIAALQGQKQEVAKEAADLLYHLLVLLSVSGTTPGEVWQELSDRRGQPPRGAAPQGA